MGKNYKNSSKVAQNGISSLRSNGMFFFPPPPPPHLNDHEGCYYPHLPPLRHFYHRNSSDLESDDEVEECPEDCRTQKFYTKISSASMKMVCKTIQNMIKLLYEFVCLTIMHSLNVPTQCHSLSGIHSVSLKQCHSITHSLSFTQFHSHNVTHSESITHCHSLSFTNSLSLTQCHSNSVTHSESLTHCHSLSFTHTMSLTRSQSLTVTHLVSLTHCHSLSFANSLSITQCLSLYVTHLVSLTRWHTSLSLTQCHSLSPSLRGNRFFTYNSRTL